MEVHDMSVSDKMIKEIEILNEADSQKVLDKMKRKIHVCGCYFTQ